MKKLALLLIGLSTQVAFGQAIIAPTSVVSEKPKKAHAWELEVDPIAYALHGYSAHGIYSIGKVRLDGGIYGIRVPEAMSGNKGFQTDMSGFGVKAQYMWQNVKGFYTGIDAGYAKTEATHKETDTSDFGEAISLGVNVGYRIFLQKPKEGQFRGFYLNPWMG